MFNWSKIRNVISLQLFELSMDTIILFLSLFRMRIFQDYHNTKFFFAWRLYEYIGVMR